jgi:hypothetical protein
VDDQELHFFTEVHGHMASLLGVKLMIRLTGNWGCICPRYTAKLGTSHLNVEHLREHGPLIMEMHNRVGGYWTAMIMDTKENRSWPSLGWILWPDQFRLEGLSRQGATRRWVSGCYEFAQSRIPVELLGMESPFRGTIDGLCREAGRTADDGGAQQTLGGRDMGHGEVRAQDPGDRGDLMARSDSDSAHDKAEDGRVVLVPVKPMPQWRPHPQAVRHHDG